VTELRSDICVIGGGPAGASMARRLVMLGHSVILIEKTSFPRHHIGESITAAVLPLLEILGVRDRIENAGFLRPRGALLCWAAPDVYYREAPGEAGFQVERPLFDSLLLAAARSAGVVVLQPARILALEHAKAGAWRIRVRTVHGLVLVRSRALADTSGRRCVTGGRKQIDSPATLAISGYWRNVPAPGEETRIEAGPDEWYWGAPLARGEFNATVFIDPSRYRPGVLKAGSPERFYVELLGRSRLLRTCLAGQLARQPLAHDATCYSDCNTVTAQRIRAGEAAFTIDPLSSQGVTAAIGSALHGATVLHTILERPSDTAIAIGFYRNRMRVSVTLHSRAARQFYSDAAERLPSPFWLARKQPRDPPREVEIAGMSHPENDALVSLSKEVRIAPVPISIDDFITTSPGVFAPGLDSPAVFLNRIPLAPLFANVVGPEPVSDLLERWEKSISAGDARKVLQWALAGKILFVLRKPA